MISKSVKNWLLYYRASLIDASRGRKNDMLKEPIIKENFNLSCFENN